ncbi:MAG TPA: CoA ester lyase [Nitrososphaera sp.]|jgi:citrate lyase subunit beta/citryl-CoA lyase|nr:CoA ester lyase [Nitrososphaera sp.]
MFRSLIFVPGNNARFVEKAKTLTADIICLDLEDSVPANEKSSARRIIADALAHKQDYQNSIYVRTNSVESGLVAEDLAAAVRAGLDGVVVPKVNDDREIMDVVKQISSLESASRPSVNIMPSIETAKGVVNAYRIASADDRINCLVFGVFDFLHDMKLDYDEHDPTGYSYARAKIPVDARAAGIDAIDAIWQKIEDLDGLARDATTARLLGYSGKSIIHPSQIELVHNVFRPSMDQIKWARKVVLALGEAMDKGSGRGAVSLEGKMIDAVHYKQAKAILKAVDE